MKTKLLRSKYPVIFILLFFITAAYAQTPQHYNFNTPGSGNSFPFNIAGGKKVQILYLANDFNQPTPADTGFITKIYIMMAANLGPYTYTNFSICMGQTNLTVFNTGTWNTDTLDTVYYRPSVSFQGTQAQWMVIPLDTPFFYDPAKSLIIQIEQCGAPGATGFSTGHTVLPGFRRNTSLVGTTCPFVWGQQSGQTAHLGIDMTLTGINNNTTNVPEAFILEQNYPNPFNPVTTISYSLPERSNITIKVYDSMGREVSSLVNNEAREPGIYKSYFDGTELTSGVYFYKITVSSINGNSILFSETRRMMLVK